MTENTTPHLSLAAVMADIEQKTDIRHTVCIDPDARKEVEAAQDALTRAESDHAQAVKRADLARADAYLSDTITAPSTEAVDKARELLDELRTKHADKQLVVVFRGWLGKEYDALVRSNAQAATAAKDHGDIRINLDDWNAFCEAAYKHVETSDGQIIPDADMDTAVYRLMNAGDRMAVARRITDANERPSSLPF